MNTTDRQYDWSLMSRLADMLNKAEARFGQRDMSWTLLGIEFGPDKTPKTRLYDDGSRIGIRLGGNAHQSEVVACYQIAHEVIHLLAPTDGNALAIEEGLATVFSEDYVKEAFGQPIITVRDAYDDAADRVRELLAIDSASIRKLRGVAPSFCKMTIDTFDSAGLTVPPALASALLAPFVK